MGSSMNDKNYFKCPNCGDDLHVSDSKVSRCCEFLRVYGIIDAQQEELDLHKHLLFNLCEILKMSDSKHNKTGKLIAENIQNWLDKQDEKHQTVRNWTHEGLKIEAFRIIYGKEN